MSTTQPTLKPSHPLTLTNMGWRPFFQGQLQLDELEGHRFGRIIEHHRSEYIVQFENHQLVLPITNSLPKMCVGDWLVFNESFQFVRLLDSFSSFSRKAAGHANELQMIASNIDTVFIVCSLNKDFNLNRIERFLALVNEADVQAVIVLSKKDMCENWEDYVQEVQKLNSLLIVEAVNALDPESVNVLRTWCETGQTITCLGSSGVGKSTLINTMANANLNETNIIRENDSKGKHTTTSRSLFQLPSGVWLMDTPGMREIQLQDCEEGVNDTFPDISQLVQECRFTDCSHTNEPGCKVLSALENGEIDSRRFNNYQKLLREQAINAASIAEKRSADKKLGKFYKATLKDAHQFKGR